MITDTGHVFHILFELHFKDHLFRDVHFDQGALISGQKDQFFVKSASPGENGDVGLSNGSERSLLMGLNVEEKESPLSENEKQIALQK